MKKITKTAALNEAITLMQHHQDVELDLLKSQFRDTYESLKPINIVKTGIKEMVSKSGLKGDLLKIAIGLTAGFLSKKFMVGSSHHPIKRMLGSLLQYAVANVVVNDSK